MKTEPEKAYVYQPLPPQKDGRFYGVGGLYLFDIDFDDAVLRGVTKEDAEKIARHCNDQPKNAAAFVEWVKERMNDEWNSVCGCRFKSILSKDVLLCDKCSELHCHSIDKKARQ